jgi:hypothetical protein
MRVCALMAENGGGNPICIRWGLFVEEWERGGGGRSRQMGRATAEFGRSDQKEMTLGKGNRHVMVEGEVMELKTVAESWTLLSSLPSRNVLSCGKKQILPRPHLSARM